MTKIIIICFKYPPEYSGYGKQLKSVISQLNNFEKNTKFTLLTANVSSKIEENENLEVVPLNGKRNVKHSLTFYLFCIKTFFWLIKNCHKYKIIHCVKAGPEAVVANFISKIFNKRLIIKVAQDELSKKELDDSKGIKRFTRQMRHVFLGYADNFIAISEEIEQNLSWKSSNKSLIHKIPNGVDTEKYQPVSSQTKLKIKKDLNMVFDEVNILFVGAINKRKGVIDLLESLQQMSNINKCSLLMCGPLLEDLDLEKRINLINKENSNLRVKYIGEVDNIEEYMKASDIFVLPSYSEGLPNVLLEAASTGLPSVVTDIGGNRDIVINNLNGFLVPIKSPQSINEGLMKLIEDKSLRISMGEAARKLVNERFSINRISKLYTELYESLLDET